MNKTPFFAALLGALGVALGAFGAHALNEQLLESGTLETWKTAVFYHLVHAAAAWSVGICAKLTDKLSFYAATCWIIGILLFSGSLYGLALGGPRWLGPITPLGGVSFIVGWLLAAIAVRPSRDANLPSDRT